jgi:hypothetical protein
VSVRITSPQEGASVKAELVVSGIVTPADATVDVNGEPAEVQNGRFTATVMLTKDDEQLQATAAANGVTDESVVEVDRLPTAAEKQAIARKKAAEARAIARKKAAKARRRAAASADDSSSSLPAGSFVMPNEVGMNLQDAQDDIQHVSGDPIFVSHSRDATGEGRYQILDRDWKVCSQNVAPGEIVSAVGHIVFSVVKDYEDCP